MTIQNTNIGQAFPLEKLGSDIARNEFNYQSILNSLIEWNNTTADTVMVRLTKDSDPWYEDFTIPSKTALFDLNAIECSVTGIIPNDIYAVDCILDSVLYGGTPTFSETSFNAALAVDVDENEITVLAGENFNVDDEVIFTPASGATIPTGITATQKYVVRTRVGNVLTFKDLDGLTIDITAVGSGIITLTKLDSDPEISESDPGDIATFRLTVANNGGEVWQLYYYPLLSTWQTNTNYRFGNYVIHNSIAYKLIANATPSTVNPALDTAHFEAVIKTWTSGDDYIVDQLVTYTDPENLTTDLYIVRQNITNSTLSPASDDGTTFKLFAPTWVSGTNYNAGSYVFNQGNPYISKVAISDSTTEPVDNSTEWEMAYILPVPTMAPFNESLVGKWYLNLDVQKFVIRNVGDGNSISETDIGLKLSIKTKEPASIYQKTVDTFPTCNYAFWPNDKTSMWDAGTTLTGTDDTKNITQRQNYSATMIFDHTNQDLVKTVNFINYDGPDLDQGLCIYLPIEVPVGESCIAVPEDGFTYEFYFRIWPNTDLTQAVTSDHIINKAQIYVYSSPTLDDVKNNNCGNPVAKFSMARATNFYVFGENIAVPDKPVCYRATFIYSQVENKWITLDYYQLPDHIFMGPVGFIDPQSPANLDLNNDVIGNINPNAANIGYETGAFPLFQDPFSTANLSPFKISDSTTLDEFRNRII